MTQATGAGGASRTRLLDVIASIGPPIAVISTVLAYFGWSQAAAQAKYMGLNVALFDFSDQDYVRFSVGNLFTPLVCLLAVGLCVLGLEKWLRGRIETGDRPAVRRIAGAAAAVGVLVAGGALLVVALQPGRTVLYAPYVVAAGVLLAAWATRLHWLAHPGKPEALSVGHRVGQGALIFGLVTLLLLWGAGDHADDVGRRAAMDIEQNLDALPRVELYSPSPLAISAPAVTETKLGTDAEPLYRYDGLHLLAVSGGRLFFLPDGWTVRSGPVVVLPDNDAVRVEYGH
ncbi:hypothetical protein [Pseudarthrobacter sp. MM222]|uniref:hypothetical protein n=1 Tax=Pseudarthrobacter sp. MM222 TaxID=3018929 RepID=UPI00222019A0|nr:hypothetical protein [Pseudarthrobacter sp. MM222]CAI3800616.1 hypothetical protein NKCBBBOE_02632 [Pseudarthrobacter sp. MM222]